MNLKKIIAAIAAAVMTIGLAVIPAMAETTGTLPLGEAFAFMRGNGIEVPEVVSVDNHNVVYTDKGVTVHAGSRYGIDEYLTGAAANIGDMTGTVFESLSNTGIYGIRNTDAGTDKNYSGWVDVNAAISEKGTYRISLLGNANNRSFKITYGTNGSVTTDVINGIGVVSADVEVTEDMINDNSVSFKITGNTTCPTIYAIHIARIDEPVTPAFTAEVVDDSFVTANGTGDYADETATGFIAKIGSNTRNTKLTSLSLSINDENKGTQNFTTNIAPNGSDVYVGIIVNQEVKADDNISITVE